MKEFMLLLRSENDPMSALSPQELQHHLEKIVRYIQELSEAGKLKSAQPLAQQTSIISGSKGKVKDGPFNESKEVILGYYLLVVQDMTEAIEIARRNPNFDLDTPTRIEIRPIRAVDGINQ